MKAALAKRFRRGVRDVARRDHGDRDVRGDRAPVDSLVLDETQGLLEVLEEVPWAKVELYA